MSQVKDFGSVCGIRCMPTDEIYVFTTCNPFDDKNIHFAHLNNKTHGNEILSQAWAIHGEDEFIFAILENHIPIKALGSRYESWLTRYEGYLLNMPVKPKASAKLDTAHHGDVKLMPPTAQDVKDARERSGLTMQAAGRLIHISGRMWSKYEAATAVMNLAYWELFIIKSNQTLSHKQKSP